MGLLFFWRRHITNAYLEQLHRRDIQTVEKALSVYESQNQKLLAENNSLANVIHRDNKLLQAVMLKAESDGDSEFACSVSELLNDRNAALESHSHSFDDTPKTGACLLDAIIGYVYNKAVKADICVEFSADERAVPALQTKISDNLTLCTLFSELGENALIALRGTPQGKVKIVLGMENELPYFFFLDNAPHFDGKVIAEMGIKYSTTHENDGGSGRGLMTAIEIAGNFGASLYLDELPAQEGYTKAVGICWGQTGRIVVRTNRREILAVCSSRADAVCFFVES